MIWFLLILYYPVLICVGLVRRLLGRDTLGLGRPPVRQSHWLVREPIGDTQSYFSEDSPTEGRRTHFENVSRKTDAGAAGWCGRPLLWLAKWYSPARKATPGTVSSAADRDKNIPDEIYTLW